MALKQVLAPMSFADSERQGLADKSLHQEVSASTAEVLEDTVADESLVEQVTSRLESLEPPVLSLGTFVVSISMRIDFRRLHVTGACPRVPGVHYAKFEVLGTSEPSVHSFHARCLH